MYSLILAVDHTFEAYSQLNINTLRYRVIPFPLVSVFSLFLRVANTIFSGFVRFRLFSHAVVTNLAENKKITGRIQITFE